MVKEIKQEVLECDTCQRCKGEHVAHLGLLQPLLEPQYACSHIALDFIEGLPTSRTKNVILVVVDRFTKHGHFLPLLHPFTTTFVAKLVLDNIYKLYDMPQSIISDRGKIFTSAFWPELFKKMGTKLQLSLAYHPQTDGQTERLNQCLEMYLRCTVY
ncbi:retrotransposon, unclassified [Olea europaea subsp. europaea]|uniref:Retrotransposon, unclassified n=1 Tax=Olea europaea subsp. europaea TaxID=158383 RepID=A0A8S0QXD9_OLEEU|nr:retrotransposon, unclassified [Olea europaea subsp. europaea]